MNWLSVQNVAQVSVEHVLNSLPESLLVVFCAWLLLRLIGRQNSGTRFAVWFIALAAVVALSFAGGIGLNEAHTLLPNRQTSHLVIPVFWAVILFGMWAIVAFVSLIRLLTGLWQVRTIRRSSAEIAPAQLPATIDEIFKQYSAGRSVRLAVSDRIKVPAAIGFWKPVIMLPTWTLQELTPDQLEPILVHELTHLKRRDDWTNLLQKLVRAVFFFHPAIWWIDARLSLEREMACDDAVLAKTGNPQGYASCLIDLLEKSCARRKWTMAQAAVHHVHELSLRITQILDAKRPATTQVWKPALGLAGVLSLSCFALPYFTPRWVAFAPNASAAESEEARIAKVHAVLRADEADTPHIPAAAIIPASYHIPAPKPRATVDQKKIAKQHANRPATIRLTADNQSFQVARRTIMAKTVNVSIRKDAITDVQMVVYIESANVSYAPAAESINPAANWKAQMWQIVLIVPAQNAAQAGIPGSLI